MTDIEISLENFSLIPSVKEVDSQIKEKNKGHDEIRSKWDGPQSFTKYGGQKKGERDNVKSPNVNSETKEGKKESVQRLEIEDASTTNPPKHKQVWA